MRRGLLAVTLMFACLCAVAAPAQEMSDKKGDTIFFIYKLTPKVGMYGKFQEAFMQHVEWRKQQGDPMTWIVAEILTGEDAGSYYVRTENTTWGFFDTYDVPGWQQHFEETVSPYMEDHSLVIAQVDDVVRNLPPDNSYYNIISITHMDINYGKMTEFRNALVAFHKALQAGNAPFYYEVIRAASGESENHMGLVTFHKNFADLETPDKDPFAYLVKHVGEEKAMELGKMWNSAVKKSYNELIRVRPDMSLMQPPPQ